MTWLIETLTYDGWQLLADTRTKREALELAPEVRPHDEDAPVRVRKEARR